MVENKVALNSLNKLDIIPKNFLGIKTDVIETGTITLNSASSNLTSNSNDVLIQKLRSRTRPIEGGLEISPYRAFIAGTLGGIVYDKKTDKPYILSNSHCLDIRGKYPKGTPISQPSVALARGAFRNNIIAYFLKSIEIKFSTKANPIYNLADCAIAEIAPGIQFDNTVLSIGDVRGSADAMLNLPIKKVGRTTGFSEGLIKTLNVSTGIKASADAKESTLFYKDLVRCDHLGQHGDSGSLVLDPLNRCVGLLSFSSTVSTYFTPIKIILDLLDIVI